MASEVDTLASLLDQQVVEEDGQWLHHRRVSSLEALHEAEQLQLAASYTDCLGPGADDGTHTRSGSGSTLDHTGSGSGDGSARSSTQHSPSRPHGHGLGGRRALNALKAKFRAARSAAASSRSGHGGLAAPPGSAAASVHSWDADGAGARDDETEAASQAGTARNPTSSADGGDSGGGWSARDGDGAGDGDGDGDEDDRDPQALGWSKAFGIGEYFGTYRFSDGGTYEGGWSHGLAHGLGRRVNVRPPWRFKGLWHRGKQQGPGVHLWGDGSSFSGEWRSGKMCGTGLLQILPAIEYLGEIWDGRREGYGVQRDHSTGRTFEGTWVNDRPEGFGVERYPDGGFYEGQWKSGRREGLGRRVQCGPMDPEAEAAPQDDSSLSSSYEEFGGQLSDVGAGLVVASFYIGEWQADQRTGAGVKVWPNKAVYQGHWSGNLRHGYGIMKHPDGVASKQGRWVKDSLQPVLLNKRKEKIKKPHMAVNDALSIARDASDKALLARRRATEARLRSRAALGMVGKARATAADTDKLIRKAMHLHTTFGDTTAEETDEAPSEEHEEMEPVDNKPLLRLRRKDGPRKLLRSSSKSGAMVPPDLEPSLTSETLVPARHVPEASSTTRMLVLSSVLALLVVVLLKAVEESFGFDIL